MRVSSIVSFLAAAKVGLAKTGPFLQQISPSQWVIGNDLWNVTQGVTYATNLQYQGSDAVGTATGHYAGYGNSSADSESINWTVD
jgi:rhamnogalacturonan endolyase